MVKKASVKVVEAAERRLQGESPVKEEVKEVEVKKSRKHSAWLLALKEFNKGKPVYHIPKVGSNEHNEVKKIQARLSKMK